MDLLQFLGIFITFLVYGREKVARAECLADTQDHSDTHNLSLLQKWNPWNAVAHIENNTNHFSINFCGPGPKCPQSSICWQKSEDEAVNIGNATTTLISYPNQHSGGFQVNFTGDVCNSSLNIHWTTSIEFKCGTTLGSPEFLYKNNCSFAFEWHTTVACKSVPHPAISEVPCYVYDEQHQKRDLSPLIKQVGGYLVDSDGDKDFYINVCRDITPDGSTSLCPTNTSGCLLNDGSFDMGRADRKLEILNNDKLRLMYSNPVQQEGCHGYSPVTKITFVCPRESGRFGGSKDPVLISDTNCHYVVEWQTEYACEMGMYVSNGDCQFTYDNDGVDIDLRPLRDSGTTFIANEMNENGEVANKYYIKVCQELGSESDCGSSGRVNVSVCQSPLPEEMVKRHSAGSFSNYNLRYTDGEVILTYSGGDVCNHNLFQRTSVITFKCNKTAGEGMPTFISEVHCMYFFEWQTSHVCLEHSRDTTCRVNHNQHRFDLSSLVREKGGNWEALDGRHNHDTDAEGVYYINICADILPEDLRTTDCPAGASACFVDHSGKTESLGRFKQSPEYDDGEIVLTYVDGDQSTDGKCTKTTVIRFICTPGDMESAPSLVRVTEHECKYEFEWRTAAACPLARRTGENCRVFDDDAGFTFDLSPLRKDEGSHTVSFGPFNYFLNVCGPVSGTACNGDETSIASPGACQVDKESGNHFTLGVANSTLEYFDGILKLSYMMGTPYHKKQGEEVAPHRQADIVFLCDMNQNDYGNIEFVGEADHAYTFKWYTKYACPQPPVECVIRDEATHNQYDLSSLSKALEEDNWMYSDSSDPTSIRKYYINVCRPINPLPLCGSFAAGCQTRISGDKEVEGVRSLGVASSAPIVESEGNLLLEYDGGSLCGSGQNRTKTKIHFRCRKGKLDSSPQLLGSFNEGCLYIFMWETEAACPISTSSGSNCTVQDENSGYVFNMHSLSFSPFYEPRSNNLAQTRINICGKVEDMVCKNSAMETFEGAGACVKSGSDWLALGKATNNLVYSDDGLLTLTYQGEAMSNGQFKEAVITFICRHNISVSKKIPETVSCNGFDKCYFNFETPLACLPESVDCLVSDPEGNQYDLSPLAKDDGNWEAVDTRNGKEHVSYHINVCKPLYSVDPEVMSCPGGPIAACQTNSDTHTGTNLGYVQAMPEAAADGSLSIRYVGGDMCEGNPSSQKSTRINFECSDTPGSPIFQTETEFCEYIFTWQTPAACPLKRETGSNCTVTVTELGYQFDLNSLHDTTKNYVVTSGEYTYTLNVCGNLVGDDETCAGAGACQDIGSKKFIAGKANQNLTYDSGILKLNYTGGAVCHSVYERSTAINFVCDTSVKGKGNPVFIRETADCTYMFEWATSLACPPFEQVECSYRDEQAQFDLAPLTTMDDNYMVVPTKQKNGEVFYLTLCRSLMNDKDKRGSKCPINAAACMEIPGKNGADSQYINLGQVSSGPTMEDGHLVVRYNLGDPCPTGNKMRSTVINFDCDPNAVGSLPQFSDSDDDCTYSFLWMTKLACDLGHEDETEQNCRVANPITGYEFDLKVLQSVNSVNIYGHDQHVYNISICKKLENSVCEDKDVGACQVQSNVASPKHFSTGNFNKKVFFDDGVLSLQYNMGTPCHNSKFFRSTVINFVCPHEENNLGEPVFISETEDCTYYFSWHTSAACEEYIQCSVMNGTSAIDLSPLVYTRGYYIATSDMDNPKSMYINLCRPLNPIQGMLCPPNAAVCQINNGKPESLGRLEHGPQMDDNGRVFIKYTNGRPCDEEPTRNVSSVITFFCRKGEEKGVPNLVDYSDCTYNFDWFTYVVCPPAAPSKGEDCTYRNDVMEYIFDLNSLAKKTYKMSAGNQKQISLRLCGPLDSPASGCEDAAVCLKDGSNTVSLGQTASQEFLFQGGNLKVTYRDGASCPGDENEKRETTILFMCMDSKQSEDPTFFTADADYCHTTLQWNTPIACPPLTMPCTATNPDQGGLFDLQPLSQITGSWTTKDSNKNKYFINVCKPALNTPSGCPNEASLCRIQESKNVEVLGMIYTQTLEYKEDSQAVLLTYSEGKVYTCASNVSRQGYDSRVEVSYKCGTVVGSPIFESEHLEDDICTFKFSWTSKVACQVEKHSAIIQKTTYCRAHNDFKPYINEDPYGFIIQNSLGEATSDGSSTHVTISEKGHEAMVTNESGSLQHEVQDFMETEGKRTPVTLKDGKIEDPETGVKLDLKPLITGGSENGAWLVEGDDRSQSANSLDAYKYYVMLDNKEMQLHDTSQECSSAAVCQTKEDDRFFRNIGLQSEKKFYLEDETLELVTRNPNSCRKDQSDVLSTIIFQCDANQTPGKPQFYYESGNCQYFFIWPTSHVCQSPPTPPDGGNSDQNASPSKGGSFGKVVFAFLIVVVICVIIIVFHKRERRSAVYFRVRKCFPGAYSNVPTYSYSQLSSGDNMDPGANESRGLFDSDAEDEEIIKETRPNPLEYRDDSDEDLLIDSRV